MIPTLYGYSEALQAPERTLATLKHVRVVYNDNGLPRLHRLGLFAEAQIDWNNGRWLLCAPLSSLAICHVERVLAQLKQQNSEIAGNCHLLRNELTYTDSQGIDQQSDLVLRFLPKGDPLSEVLGKVPKEVLLQALDTLQANLQLEKITHNNLKAENIIWSAGQMYPIRFYYACTGQGDDSAAFEALRRQISNTPDSQTLCDVATDTYTAPCKKSPAYLWEGHVFEQLICVANQAGYGYVDTNHQVVIAPQYVWADDFHEGRAAVQTATGMGLIDKTGRYIIPPHYEIVEYDSYRGTSQVRLNGVWARFDYMGRQLTEFNCTVDVY
ncbi:MAG: WG repeat-containing protein [Alistipes sp.]